LLLATKLDELWKRWGCSAAAMDLTKDDTRMAGLPVSNKACRDEVAQGKSLKRRHYIRNVIHELRLSIGLAVADYGRDGLREKRGERDSERHVKLAWEHTLLSFLQKREVENERKGSPTDCTMRGESASGGTSSALLRRKKS